MSDSHRYHSHFSLQYAEGLFGPLIINGPATADYDEDLGALFLQDWSHDTAFSLWHIAQQGAPPTMENILINGTNTFEDGGSRFETSFVEGTKYRMRLLNVATDGHLRFSIDNHTFSVIAMDLVPIIPYETDNLLISIGQRYDIVVEATASDGDYWLRAGWQSACATNGNPDNALGIIRYDTSSTADPTSTSDVTSMTDSCYDEPLESLVPYVPLTVGDSGLTDQVDVSFAIGDAFTWTINSSSLYLNWSMPTNLDIYNNVSIFPTPYNVIALPQVDEWVYIIIQDASGIGYV